MPTLVLARHAGNRSVELWTHTSGLLRTILVVEPQDDAKSHQVAPGLGIDEPWLRSCRCCVSRSAPGAGGFSGLPGEAHQRMAECGQVAARTSLANDAGRTRFEQRLADVHQPAGGRSRGASRRHLDPKIRLETGVPVISLKPAKLAQTR